jgi:plastocyanin
MKIKVLNPIACLLTAILFAASLSAETYYVGVDDSGFSPSTLNINVGDTVVWVNYDEFFPHTTTSDLSVIDPDYWNYIFSDFEEEFSQTFNNAGTFTYYDQSGSGTGTVIVTAVQASNISLEAPRIEGGQFLFEATGLTVGKTNVLEVSANLSQWTAISTNVAEAASMTFTNSISPGANLFRVIELE